MTEVPSLLSRAMPPARDPEIQTGLGAWQAKEGGDGMGRDEKKMDGAQEWEGQWNGGEGTVEVEGRRGHHLLQGLGSLPLSRSSRGFGSGFRGQGPRTPLAGVEAAAVEWTAQQATHLQQATGASTDARPRRRIHGRCSVAQQLGGGGGLVARKGGPRYAFVNSGGGAEERGRERGRERERERADGGEKEGKKERKNLTRGPSTPPGRLWLDARMQSVFM